MKLALIIFVCKKLGIMIENCLDPNHTLLKVQLVFATMDMEARVKVMSNIIFPYYPSLSQWSIIFISYYLNLSQLYLFYLNNLVWLPFLETLIFQVQKFGGYNGYFGCFYCRIVGKHFANRVHTYFPLPKKAKARRKQCKLRKAKWLKNQAARVSDIQYIILQCNCVVALDFISFPICSKLNKDHKIKPACNKLNRTPEIICDNLR